MRCDWIESSMPRSIQAMAQKPSLTNAFMPMMRSERGSAGDAHETDDDDDRGENDEQLRQHRSRPDPYFGALGGVVGGVAGVAGADAGALAGVEAGAVAGADDDPGAGVLAGAAGFGGGADPLNTDPGPR